MPNPDFILFHYTVVRALQSTVQYIHQCSSVTIPIQYIHVLYSIFLFCNISLYVVKALQYNSVQCTSVTNNTVHIHQGASILFFLGISKIVSPHMLPWGLWRTNFFFFFYPKTKVSWPPKVWYFWKIPQSLLVIFSSFLFLRKVQERTENTKKN